MSQSTQKSLTQHLASSRSGHGSTAAVFIHGFLDAGAIWAPVLARLTAPDLETVVFDLPGMGGSSDAAGPFSYERYAEEVAALVDSLDKPVLLVGQSMGAVIAQMVAARRPQKVRGLALVSPVPVAGVQGPPEAIDPFRRLGDDPQAQRQTRKFLSPHLTTGQLEELGAFGDLVRPATVAALVDTWNGGQAADTPLSSFVGPVLVIRGDEDPLVTAAVTESVAEPYARGSVHTIPRGGHWVHFEQPDAVAPLLDELLALTLATDRAADWKGAFAEKKSSDFAASLAADVVLEASVMRGAVQGRAAVSEIMGHASALYETLVFTEQVADGPRQYIQWTARTFGGPPLAGVTILTRDDAGLIARIAIHHRPFEGLLDFSERLGKRLADTGSATAQGLFFTGAHR